MNYTLAVFKSRSSTLYFANLLRQTNIPCSIINTPYSIQRACGISVKLLSDFTSQAHQILMSHNLSLNFSGFYVLSNSGRWMAV